MQCSPFHSSSEIPPDPLGGALLRTLMRPADERSSWHIAKNFGWGVLTSGLLPLIVLSRKLQYCILYEREQFGHAVKWIQARSPSPSSLGEGRGEGPRIPRITPLMRLLFRIGQIAPFVAIGGFLYLHYPNRVLLEDFYAVTWSRTGGNLDPTFFYAAALSLGYIAHWIVLQLHASQTRAIFRTISARGGTGAMPFLPGSTFDAGVRPLWMIGGLVLTFAGALWAMPMMLAAGALRRYTKRSSVLMKATIANRIRTQLRGEPAAMLPGVPVALRQRCASKNCQAPLKPSAMFCPRCGTRSTL